jgi:hypothetical protein
MLNSRAYRALPPSAAKALPFFLGKVKVKHFDQARFHEEFRFSYGEGKRYGFAPATFSRVIQALVRTGFIDPVDKGGLRSDGKRYNLFRLSRRWELFGTIDFESLNWKCFQPRLKVNATSKMETYSFKNGNKRGNGKGEFSENEAVGGDSA